jgi:hypothetical protein
VILPKYVGIPCLLYSNIISQNGDKIKLLKFSTFFHRFSAMSTTTATAYPSTRPRTPSPQPGPSRTPWPRVVWTRWLTWANNRPQNWAESWPKAWAASPERPSVCFNLIIFFFSLAHKFFIILKCSVPDILFD